MNWVDVVIALLVLGLGFMGWRNGVIKLIFTLAGGIIGLLLAGQLWEQVADLLPIESESISKLAAFVMILAAAMIISWIAARIVKTMLKVFFLGWVDDLAGAAIGLLLGGIAATAVVSAAGIVPSQTVKDAVAESTLAEPLIKSMGIVYAFLPAEFDSVKDLVSQGKGLLDQSKGLIENTDKLQDLLSQDSELLEAAVGLKARAVMVGFAGLTDFADMPLVPVLEVADGGFLPALTTSVLGSGNAVLPVDSLSEELAHTMTYYVDTSDNSDCDDDEDDMKGALAVGAGATKAGTAYIDDDGSSNGLCGAF